MSTQKGGQSKTKIAARMVNLAGKSLGYGDSISAGDFVMQQVKAREGHLAQQGAVRTMFLDGAPVRPEDQWLTKAEIRKNRR